MKGAPNETPFYSDSYPSVEHVVNISLVPPTGCYWNCTILKYNLSAPCSNKQVANLNEALNEKTLSLYKEINWWFCRIGMSIFKLQMQYNKWSWNWNGKFFPAHSSGLLTLEYHLFRSMLHSLSGEHLQKLISEILKNFLKSSRI